MRFVDLEEGIDFYRTRHESCRAQPKLFHGLIASKFKSRNLVQEKETRIIEIIRLQVVDMRWGVRDEATDDHMTTELCMREIENCQRLSMGPNFVVEYNLPV